MAIGKRQGRKGHPQGGFQPCVVPPAWPGSQTSSQTELRSRAGDCRCIFLLIRSRRSTSAHCCDPRKGFAKDATRCQSEHPDHSPVADTRQARHEIIGMLHSSGISVARPPSFSARNDVAHASSLTRPAAARSTLPAAHVRPAQLKASRRHLQAATRAATSDIPPSIAPDTLAAYKKVQNGSDVRGVALDCELPAAYLHSPT